MPVFNNALAGAAGSGGADAYEIKRSLRFNGGDSANLSRSPSITNGTTGAHSHWTFSAWVKRTKFGVTNQPIFGAMNGSNREGFIAFNSDDTLRFSETGPSQSSYNVDLHTSQKFRDPSAWYHIVVVYAYNQYTFDKARIYVNGVEVTEFGTKTIGGGLYDESYINTNGANHYIGKYLNYSNQATHGDMYLANVHFVPGYTVPVNTDDADGSVTGIPNAKYLTEFGQFDSTTGVWNPKEYEGTYPRDGGFHLDFSDNSSDSALGNDAAGSNNWTVNNINANSVGSNAVIGAWASGWSGTQMGNYQPRNMFDGSTGTLTAFGSGGGTWSKSTGNGIPATSSVELFYILRSGSGSVSINGNSLGLSEGWQNISSLFSFPTEITAMTLAQNAGNGPDIRAMKVDGKFVIDNWSAGLYPYETPDSVIDSPTNYEADSGNNGGNYPTWNPLDNGGGLDLSNGNLDAADTNNNHHRACRATQRIPNSGKWYFELSILNLDNTIAFGIDTSGAADPDLGGSGRRYLLVNSGGNVQRYDGSAWTEFSGQSGLGSGIGAGSVMQVAVDQDAGKLWFGVDNVWLGSSTSAAGNPSNGTNPTLTGTYTDAFPVVNCVNTKGAANFGQRSFVYTPPTGFKSLCTQNLDNPPIAKGSKYFEAKTYSGSGSTQSITGLEFSPDLTWIKPRNANDHHILYDTVRGVRNQLYSNLPNAEETETQGLSAFTSDGFTVNGTHTVRGQTNDTGKNYISWNWDAGSSTTPISVGGLNSSVYDQSQNWSSLLSASGGSGFSNQGNGAFAGTDSNADYTYVTGATGGTNYTITFTPPSTVNFTSSVVVRVEANHGEASIDGGSTWVSGGSSGVCTFAGPGSFSSIIVRDARGQYSGEFHSIRIDGKLLVNSGVTPPNVPSIATTVRANPSAGFSVITWTGNGTSGGSIAHGLSTPPKLLLIKDTDTAYNWYVVTTATGSNIRIEGLNNTNGGGGITEYVTDSSVISNLSQHASLNTSGATMLIYAFSPVEGYSAIGSYESNGVTNGPFVYTGFRPRWLLIRHSGSGQDWVIIDTARDLNNDANTQKLTANEVNGEVTQTVFLDILSNGFKLRSNAGAVNDGNNPYFYLALAENPFKYARAF